VRDLAALPDIQVVAAYDPRPEWPASARGRYTAARTIAPTRAPPADLGIDAVAIATPISTRYHPAMQVLQADQHVPYDLTHLIRNDSNVPSGFSSIR
jgi:predicted dehydrogenase